MASANDSPSYLSLSLEELGQIKISIATGNETPIEDAPAIASVITAEEIGAMGARTLNEALAAVPGLHLSLSGLNRTDTTYSIRGIHNSSFNPQVLLLIDGTPVTWPSQGGRPTRFSLPASHIKRIEVIRGPGSAIYGADAFSGVINVVSKTVDDIDSIETGVRLGSFNTQDFWLLGEKIKGDTALVFAVDYQQADGDSSRIITDTLGRRGALNTQYELLNLHASLSRHHWHMRWWSWLSSNSGLGAGGAQVLDARGNDDSAIHRMAMAYDSLRLIAHWRHQLTLSYSQYKTQAQLNLCPENTVENYAVIGNPGGRAGDTQLALTTIYTGLAQHRWRLSLGKRWQSINTNEARNFDLGATSGVLTDVTDSELIFLPDASRTTQYVSIQDEWDISPSWQWITGLRTDHYSDFGNTTNPRMALIWQARPTLTGKLLYGSAFRAPAFSEQFSKNTIALGNPQLQPETIDTYELSLSYHPHFRFHTILNFFSYKASNLIDYVSDSATGGNTAANARDQQGEGIEWEFDWKPHNRWRLNGSYALQYSQDSANNMTIANAPEQKVFLSSHWDFAPKWSINKQIHWVAGRRREHGDTRSAIGDYTLVNLSLRHRSSYKGWGASLAIRNLFDTDAREPSDSSLVDDFPLEGRKLWLALHYHLPH